MNKILIVLISCLFIISCGASHKETGKKEISVTDNFKQNINKQDNDHRQRIKLNISDYEVYEFTNDSKYPEIGEIRKSNFKVYFGIKKAFYNVNNDPLIDKSFEYIKEIVYFLERDKDIIPLGLLSKKGKFINGYGDSILISKTNDSFYSSQFQGFKIDSISHPLFLEYVAVDDNNHIFESDGSFNLLIDQQNLVIKIRPIEY